MRSQVPIDMNMIGKGTNTGRGGKITESTATGFARNSEKESPRAAVPVVKVRLVVTCEEFSAALR